MTPNSKHVRLAAIGTATPPYVADQRQAEDFFTRYFAHRLSHRSLELMRKFLAHPSIRERCFAINNPGCLVQEHPDDKIARFLKWAVELSAQASRRALAGAGLEPEVISVLVVNTCTGYLCPGLTSYLVEELGLSRSVRAYDLVGSGCGGAVPNLQVGEEYLKANGAGAALCIAVEICSATFQMENDLSLILSNALFGDGAAAAVLWTRPQGLELVAAGSRHQPEHREIIRYVNKNGQLYNQLSRTLPEIVSRAVAEAVRGVLEAHGLTGPDIAHWALHSGGDRVITAIAKELGLPEEKLAPTRTVLARYGNMSSPSVLFSLREILNNGMRPHDWCVLASFGAGLSAHALLLKSR